MNPCIEVVTLIALSLFWNQPIQVSWEERALERTRRMLASDLDPALPRQPFAEWLGKTVRQQDSAIVWQIAECGVELEVGPDGGNDQKACVEANTILADGRKVILRLAVGTFKQGMVAPPAFQFGVMEIQGELRQIRRLRDLQPMILNPDSLPNNIIILPNLNADSASKALKTYAPAMLTEIREFVGLPATSEDSEDLPPKPREKGTQAGLRQGAPIKKVQPVYPRNNNAKRYNAAGPVEVLVTIGVNGRVTTAKAVKGHPLLREAAVEAARQWEFEPTTINGVPMETQQVLTFVFTTPPQ